MSMLFSESQLALLQKHLQAICEVEFFTIGLYLTATYSFTDAALQWPSPGSKLQQKALSVAVQEMYHLQLACNIANAFGVTPNIPTTKFIAGQEITIPHLEIVKGQPLTTKLGNLPQAIQAMVDIELPDPDPHFQPPNDAVIYRSISDLYHATLALLNEYLISNSMVPISQDPNFMPGRNQVVYGTFATTYQHNEVESRMDVAKAANAISDQGEGKLVAANLKSRFFSTSTQPDVLPEFQPAQGTRFYQFGMYSHFQRFVQIQDELKTQEPALTFYEETGEPSPDLPSWAADYKTNQDALNIIWTYLVQCMQDGFGSGKLSPNYPNVSDGPSFNDAMLSTKYLVPIIWQCGHAPSYSHLGAKVTPQEVQTAMDAVDPLCLYHWDAATAKLRAAPDFQPNACQGLNTGSGTGWGGLSTGSGTGACATADFHTCGGNNDCKLQGGCAFLSTDSKGGFLESSEQWIPNENSCKTKGGCQTPIAVEQVFDTTAGKIIDAQTEWTAEAKAKLTALIGQSVWAQARTALGYASDPLVPPQTKGKIDYDGTKRRTAIQATSTK